MELLARIFVGLLFAAIGILIMYYSYHIKNFFGSWGWAERSLGSGGTYTAWKLIGLGFMFLGLLWATDTLGGIMRGIFGPFFGGIA